MPSREQATEDAAPVGSAPAFQAPQGKAAHEQVIRMPAQRAGGISEARLSALELNPGRFTLERLLLILAALNLELVVRARRRLPDPVEW